MCQKTGQDTAKYNRREPHGGKGDPGHRGVQRNTPENLGE